MSIEHDKKKHILIKSTMIFYKIWPFQVLLYNVMRCSSLVDKEIEPLPQTLIF